MNILEKSRASAGEFQAAVVDFGIGGEETAEEVFLGGETGGEGFIAEAAVVFGFGADEGFHSAEKTAMGDGRGEGGSRTLTAGRVSLIRCAIQH